MRHLLGFVLGIVLSPLILLGTAWSGMRVYRHYAVNGDNDLASIVVPVVVLLACAVVYAFVVSTRISPLAAFLVGLPWAVAGVLGVFLPQVLTDLLPLRYAVSQQLQVFAVSGAALLIGFAGVLQLVVPSHWRRWSARPASPDDPGAGIGSTDGPQYADYASPRDRADADRAERAEADRAERAAAADEDHHTRVLPGHQGGWQESDATRTLPADRP